MLFIPRSVKLSIWNWQHRKAKIKEFPSQKDFDCNLFIKHRFPDYDQSAYYKVSKTSNSLNYYHYDTPCAQFFLFFVQKKWISFAHWVNIQTSRLIHLPKRFCPKCISQISKHVLYNRLWMMSHHDNNMSSSIPKTEYFFKLFYSDYNVSKSWSVLLIYTVLQSRKTRIHILQNCNVTL